MLFNSIEYVLFFPVVIIIYFLLNYKYRWILLLAASYFFYMSWKPEYAILILASTLIDYFCAIKMSNIGIRKKRRKFLIISLITNLGLLFAFKYFNFFSSSAHELFAQFNIFYKSPELKVLLPVGISFYTFQTLSYSLDVYYDRQKPERHLGYFAVFVSFFPQLVAGPIERYSNLGPQFRKKISFNYDHFTKGLRLILYGLFIKMVIADNLAYYVDQIYENPLEFNSLSVLTGTLFYSFQIYSDFYGYSLIAIGSALVIGIKIMNNFRTPYLSQSITEFWQRWHISLSTWFRDYLYIPLGGNKRKVPRWILNIIIVFTVSGFWHGANWTFIIWGAAFGIAYMIEKLSNNLIGRISRERFGIGNLLLIVKTFVIVTALWIFFRSENLNHTGDIFSAMVNNMSISDNFLVDTEIWIFLGIFVISDLILFNTRFDIWCDNKPSYIRWPLYLLLLYLIIVYTGVENTPFIYFQF